MEIFMKHKLCWVLLLYLCLNLIINYNGVEGFQKTSVNPDHSRTAYHFQPPMLWINDPNAPMYYKGYYHLFYQYNPWGSTWASNLVWGHSYSKDLINWIPLETAIRPSAPFDIIGAWSGSATILPGDKPIILYTGLVSKNSSDKSIIQVQNIAFPKNSSDPLLREWIKPDYNPVIIPNKFMNASEFRDPTTAWYSNDGFWRVSVGHTRRNRGIAEVYKTRDFKTWTRGKRPLHSKADTGMWECPDFFPVSLKGKNGLETSVNGNHVKHILKVTFQLKRLDIYIVGRYNAARERFIPDPTSVDKSTGLRYDYGNVYATKSFFDEKYNRRILFGWSNESDTKVADIRKGWAGIQLIPRSLWLDQSGKQLIQWPIKELESIRGNAVHMKNVPLAEGSHREIKGITAAQADVEVTFNIPSLQYAEPFDPNWVDAGETCGYKDPKTVAGIGPFGLLTLASKNITSENITEYTPVYFHVFKFQDKPVVLMCSGGKMSSLDSKNYKPSFGGYVNVDSKARSISLRTLIDHSVVESFGAGGKTCITSRSYPTIAKGANTHLYLFNHGTIPVTVKKLDAWSMGNPQMN